jgi:hypothetical protein
MSDLIKRLREDYINPDATAAADALEASNARIAALEQELRNIANADTVEWDDPTQFESWAKSRARHALSLVAQIDKEKP